MISKELPTPNINSKVRKDNLLGQSIPSFDPDPDIPFEPTDVLEFTLPGRLKFVCVGKEIAFFSDKSSLTVVRLNDGTSHYFPKSELILDVRTPAPSSTKTVEKEQVKI